MLNPIDHQHEEISLSQFSSIRVKQMKDFSNPNVDCIWWIIIIHQKQFALGLLKSSFVNFSIRIFPICIYIWQVSPQLSCGDTCQIWMWYSISNHRFNNSEKLEQLECLRSEIPQPPHDYPYWWFTSDPMSSKTKSKLQIPKICQKFKFWNFAITLTRDTPSEVA